jgi:hypothetical protein
MELRLLPKKDLDSGNYQGQSKAVNLLITIVRPTAIYAKVAVLNPISNNLKTANHDSRRTP